MTIRKILFLLVLLSVNIQAKPRYAIGMFHYNFQYVAGDYRIESRIVKESLYPALQFFDENQQYKADFEFQGYAIESMEEGHKLANRLNTWPQYSVTKKGEAVELKKLFL